MKNYLKIIQLLFIALLMMAFAPKTQLRKTWTDPSLENGQIKPFKKVFIMVNARTAENKKIAEDRIVSLIKNGEAIASYTYLTPADTSQKELADRLIKDGFDGAITLRVKAVVQTKTKTSSNPGTSYSSWYGYGPYGYSYGVTYNVGSRSDNSTGNVDVNSFKDYIIETNIYSLEAKKLLWSGVTASMGAKKIEPAINGIYTTIRKELIKKGFLPK